MAEKRSYSERCKENSEPSHSGSKKQLSLKRKDPKPSCERFALVSQQDEDEAQKPIILQNTQKSTDWSVRLFTSWLSQRNQRCPDDKYPEDILLTDDHE